MDYQILGKSLEMELGKTPDHFRTDVDTAKARRVTPQYVVFDS